MESLPRRKPRQLHRADAAPATVDLHLHSTASDGVYPPAKVMELAAARGLTTVALTDHDTVAGLDEARQAAGECGLRFVNGIECDAASRRGTLHILGYFIDPNCGPLTEFLDRARSRRTQRNQALLKRLATCSVTIDLSAIAPDGDMSALGRRQLATWLVTTGVVSHPTAAFRDYLGEGGQAYVPMQSPSAPDVIKTIHAAGGVAVLAHPVTLRCANSLEFETMLAGLVHHGLDGIEVYHPAQTEPQRSDLLKAAARFNLIVTGGSDFHSLKWKQPRGIGFGESVGVDVVDALEARRLQRLA